MQVLRLAPPRLSRNRPTSFTSSADSRPGHVERPLGSTTLLGREAMNGQLPLTPLSSPPCVTGTSRVPPPRRPRRGHAAGGGKAGGEAVASPGARRSGVSSSAVGQRYPCG
eukprot:364334-Chlamydomonas_euryale.AAC.1